MQYSNCFQAEKKNYQNLWIKYILLNLIPLFMVWLIIALLLNIVFLFISNLGELFLDYASGIWLVDCYKLTINWKNDNGVTICLHYVIVIIFFFWRFVSSVNFGYWSKFYANIITGSGVKKIFFYRGLMKLHPFKFCPISWDWG